MRKLLMAFLYMAGGISLVHAQVKKTDLNFDVQKYESQTLTVDGKTIRVRAYENIVYVSNPVDTAIQKMNIYIPEEYFNGQTINGYSAKTAPIFFPNLGRRVYACPTSLHQRKCDGRPSSHGRSGSSA